MIALVLDTETSDLTHHSLAHVDRQPHVVEFCGQLVGDSGPLTGGQDRLDFLCRPPVPMQPDAARVTGLTDDMLASYPPFGEFAGGVADLMARADAVVAHNLHFDMQVLDFEFQRDGTRLEWPKWKICTVMQTEWVQGKRLKLHELHQLLFNEPIKEAHRAGNDVDALARIYVELRKREWL